MINNPTFQHYVTIGIVVLCALWLLLRIWMKRKKPGCGGDCDCPAGDFKKEIAKKK